MTPPPRLPVKWILAVCGVAASFGAWKSRWLPVRFVTGPGSFSRILALVVVLANYKNFPFVWHVRVWYAILRHVFQNECAPLTPALAGLHSAAHRPALFQPAITPSFSPVSECDYNLHKSNSSYFSDLDVARSNVVCALLHTAIEELHHRPGRVIAPNGTPARGRLVIALGGVHCSFRREIKPYEPYDMWSRIVCWDRKWVYIVTHWVKRGTVTPNGWTLDTPSTGFLPRFLRRAQKPRTATAAAAAADRAETKPVSAIPESAIFASSISKYVVKLGRLTVHPEAVFHISGLLPTKPGGWNAMDRAPVGAEQAAAKAEAEAESSADGLETMMGETGMGAGAADGLAEAAANGAAEASAAGWDWKMIEAENAKGLKFAASLGALDDLPETFTGSREPALGCYPDLL